MMDIAIFLLNNTASYSKESSVDKLYVSIFAICILFSPAIFLTSRKNISPLGSPNLFARRQAFAAIRRRTQWIKRKINGRENEKRRCCASNQGIYAANSLSHLIKKSREQWKLGNIRLHMAKINTYDFLSIRVFGRNSLPKSFNTYPSRAYEYSWHPVINFSVFSSH